MCICFGSLKISLQVWFIILLYFSNASDMSVTSELLCSSFEITFSEVIIFRTFWLSKFYLYYIMLLYCICTSLFRVKLEINITPNVVMLVFIKYLCCNLCVFEGWRLAIIFENDTLCLNPNEFKLLLKYVSRLVVIIVCISLNVSHK